MTNDKKPPLTPSGDTFGKRLNWHLLNGTRPSGTIYKPGRKWTRKDFAGALKVGARALGFWLKDKHFPRDWASIERELFGNSDGLSEWRDELAKLHSVATDSGTPPDLNTSKHSQPPRSTVPHRGTTPLEGRESAFASLSKMLTSQEGPDVVIVIGQAGVGKNGIRLRVCS